MPRRPQPYPLQPLPNRDWGSLTASAVVHVAVLLLVVLVTRPRQEESDRSGQPDPAQLARQVQMVYVPPPPEPVRPPPPPPQPKPEPPPPTPPPRPPVPPPPIPRPFSPPPDKEQKVPEDNANAPPDATRSKGEDSDQPEGGAPATTPAPAVEAAPTMESEAQRIFGSKRVATQPGAGPQEIRPMEADLPEHGEKCVPRVTSDSAGPQYGTVVGRIMRGDNGRPLAGAHLQMLGTPFVAFTGPDGEYQFRFDMSLVDNCRTQYVRVTAKGYESRLLVLLVGENVRSDDVSLQKRGRFGL
ncbi:MAG TPA: carboxypeptidase-like regulatory domain-containing protein [Gemmatimonadales bacterium]|nr:carboxypeptidase-like regulatory domain-containing protein [Gemmatimonadales bacterium]